MSVVIPAISGKMGNTNYFQCMMKVDELVRSVRAAAEIDEWANMSIGDKMQRQPNMKRIKNQIEEEKKFKLQQKKKNITQSQAPASMTLPKLDNTMMASMTAGSAGDIDPTTLLTSNETALLSPSEQAYYTNKRRA